MYRQERRVSSAAPAIRDRDAAIPSERLRAQLDAGRRLAPLVLGVGDQCERALHDLLLEAVPRQLLPGAIELDIRLEHAVELRIGRERILVELVGPELGARSPIDDGR